MSERWPPVTRAMTLSTAAGPLKVALSPLPIVKWRKLWNRLPPAWLPSSAPIA